MVDYELIDHTADIGMRVWAEDLTSLFVRSAEAMFDIIAEKPKSSKDIKKRKFNVNLSAKNTKELFVRWLSELLSLSDSKDVFFTDFSIVSLTETVLNSAVSGVSRRHIIGKREIKAVTYHDLKIGREGDQYKAEVIFDV